MGIQEKNSSSQTPNALDQMTQSMAGKHICWEDKKEKKKKHVGAPGVPRSHRMPQIHISFCPWLRVHRVRDSEETNCGHYAQTLSMSAQQDKNTKPGRLVLVK